MTTLKLLSAGTHRIPLPHGGHRRSYLLHIPPGAGPWSVVMMLHGAGGTAEFAAEETGWSSFADANGFVVVYPEGVAADPAKEPKFLTNPQEWSDGSGRGKADDVSFLNEVLGDLPTWTEIDPKRLFLTGFSNGAGMAFRYAASDPKRFRAIAPVAGHCWITPPVLGPIPTIYMIGKDDPILPFQGGTAKTPWGKLPDRPPVAETLRRWSEAIQTPVNAENFPVLYLANHGHHWPGGQAKLGEKLGGPISTEADANRLIWDFFVKSGKEDLSQSSQR
ncbi:alpha/beta hydrolase family esterase [Zavarzinella formosa]|uniref:alpha/beta hydrolase family esterase n=1 Tax=Zavarzinella formosa TaxID=360055 RepID=UPI00030720F2|nr:PHB depolymerase family esterase [Zavarzinella formosa]